MGCVFVFFFFYILKTNYQVFFLPVKFSFCCLVHCKPFLRLVWITLIRQTGNLEIPSNRGL